jgi:hypothetical protein
MDEHKLFRIGDAEPPGMVQTLATLTVLVIVGVVCFCMLVLAPKSNPLLQRSDRLEQDK